MRKSRCEVTRELGEQAPIGWMWRIRQTTRGESLLLNRANAAVWLCVDADLLGKALQNPCPHSQAASLNSSDRRGYRVLQKLISGLSLR
jgi:hypothetical protein